MSKIQRYRINPVAWEDGKGWVRQSIHSKPKVHAIEQPHKKGGWCKWEDVKALERQLAEARENIYKFAEIALMEGKDEFGHSWEDFKFYVLDEQLMEKGE